MCSLYCLEAENNMPEDLFCTHMNDKEDLLYSFCLDKQCLDKEKENESDKNSLCLIISYWLCLLILYNQLQIVSTPKFISFLVYRNIFRRWRVSQ